MVETQPQQATCFLILKYMALAWSLDGGMLTESIWQQPASCYRGLLAKDAAKVVSRAEGSRMMRTKHLKGREIKTKATKDPSWLRLSFFSAGSTVETLAVM